MGNWAHSPVHKLNQQGTYIVTGATLHKQHYFGADTRRTLLQNDLFRVAADYGWQMQAWAIFSNHYHFVAMSPGNPTNLPDMLADFHASTAKEINRLDKTRGRRVWYNYWEKHITYQRSYLARLKYVHFNPVKHGLADDPTRYRWCSAQWFERHASAAFQRTVNSFKTDKVKVFDEFSVV
ncbi:MAG: REP-associated tyrosine transposase [Candidatus Brocadiia bacterium]